MTCKIGYTLDLNSYSKGKCKAKTSSSSSTSSQAQVSTKEISLSTTSTTNVKTISECGSYDESLNFLGPGKCSKDETCQQCEGQRLCINGFCTGNLGCTPLTGPKKPFCCDRNCTSCKSYSKYYKNA